MCDCLGFEVNHDADFPYGEPECYCGHVQDEHDEDGKCLGPDDDL